MDVIMDENVFTYAVYEPLRMAIAYLLKQDEDVSYRDNQLTAALDKLCWFEESDETMINVDAKMIKQATKPRGASNIIGYGTMHFLHISYDRDGLKLGCSK